MSWSEKYKRSIDCNNPKGFSQKAHCDGKKKRKNEAMIFEEITEDILNEKLITYGNRKPYGQIVFIAGGAGSGKGFAISNFLDSSSFKVRDVDEMKKQLQVLNRLGKITIKDILAKYGRNIKLKDLDMIRKVEKEGYKLQNLNLKNPDHVYVLHLLVKAMGIKEKSLENLLAGKNNPEVLPNIMFDITAMDVTDITSVVPMLKEAGYKAENIHLTWILTNYVTAMVNNKNRSRMVPEDILLKTHEGASNTVWGLVTKALPKGMNGRVDVILNNPEHTVFYTDAEGRTINGKVKGFLSLPLKKAGGGIFPEKLWKDKLFGWVKDNAPESITANMKESVNEEQYKVMGRPVTLNKGKKSTGVDWTVTFQNGKSLPLADVLSLIKPFPKGITATESVNEIMLPRDVDSKMKELGISKIPISSQGERVLKGMVKEKFLDKVTNKERLIYFVESLGKEKFGYGSKGKPLSPLVDRFWNDITSDGIYFGGKMAAYQVAMNMKDMKANGEEIDSSYEMMKEYFKNFGMDHNRSRVFDSAIRNLEEWMKRNKM